MASLEDKKKRAGKTTRQQFAVFIEELQNNVSFRHNKFSPDKPDVLENTWQELTKKLNSTGGPQRTIQQWKKVYTDWKCNIRKKARIIQKDQKETGGGSPSEKPLNDLEEQLLNLTGKVVVTGLEEIQELGVTVEEGTFLGRENEDITEPIEDIEVLSEELPSRSSPINNTIKKAKTAKSRRKNQNSIGNGVKQLLEKNRDDVSVLQQIDNKLKQLVELKSREVLIKETKLKLKYNVTLE